MLSSTFRPSAPELPHGRIVLIAQRIRTRIDGGEVSVPLLSSSAAQLLALATTPDVDLKSLMRAIDGEPVMAARVLARANSSLYAHHGHTRSILQAAMRLGTEYLKDLVVEVIARASVFSDADKSGAAQQQEHAVICACLTRKAAELGTADADFAFTAGLLHDLGRPLAWQMLVDALGEQLDHGSREVMCDILHAAVGAQVAEMWGLPECVVEVARHHHRPRDTGEEVDDLSRLAHRFATLDRDQPPNAEHEAMLNTVATVDDVARLMIMQPARAESPEAKPASEEDWQRTLDAVGLEGCERKHFESYALGLWRQSVAEAA